MVFVSLAVTNAKAARFAGPAKSNSAIRLVGRAKGSVTSILCKGVEVVDNERRVNSPTQRAPIVGVWSSIQMSYCRFVPPIFGISNASIRRPDCVTRTDQVETGRNEPTRRAFVWTAQCCATVSNDQVTTTRSTGSSAYGHLGGKRAFEFDAKSSRGFKLE